MQIDLDLGQWIVIGLSGFLFLWYILASSANRNRGIATYRWLRQGLETLGKVSRAEWIGGSNVGARVIVSKPAKPFRRVEAYYRLEPREFLPYWLYSYLSGKRDEVIIRVTLRMIPKGALEIRRIPARKNVTVKKRVQQDFQIVEGDLNDLILMAKVEKFLGNHSSTVKKIILRDQAPHIELHAQQKSLLSASPDEYFKEILSWYQSS
jgi:hypothetical protein